MVIYRIGQSIRAVAHSNEFDAAVKLPPSCRLEPLRFRHLVTTVRGTRPRVPDNPSLQVKTPCGFDIFLDDRATNIHNVKEQADLGRWLRGWMIGLVIMDTVVFAC